MIVGPTASGKSDLALAVARAAGDVEVLTADSMQVYRGMDIGTAKPTPAERAEVPHHLIDVVDPSEDYDLARFQREARAAIAAIRARGHTPLLVGGTALYLQAVIDDLDIPGQFPEVRAEIESEPDTSRLHERLAELDPVAAARMEPTNRRRVVRALEVTLGSGRPFSSFGPGLGDLKRPRDDLRLAGIWLPRDTVATRIEVRVRQMVERGLVEEATGLLVRDPPMSRTARQALGYKEVIAHLEDGVPIAKTIDEIVRRTRHFARRQRMWFRRDERIIWHATNENPLAVLPALLGDWTRCR
ncbi:MAG: tRNA (adenosine(37)-N6)-dimethylallyltransferase MiaA [Acidimicrobiia bacterium]